VKTRRQSYQYGHAAPPHRLIEVAAVRRQRHWVSGCPWRERPRSIQKAELSCVRSFQLPVPNR